MMRIVGGMLGLLVAALVVGGCGKKDDKVKVGFIVKQPDEPWFQNEWKFAQQAADKNGFTLVKIGAQEMEKVLPAIENLAAQGAKGFVICTPDVKLGPAIMDKAKKYGMKVYAVDDQFVDDAGTPMRDVPYMGISARKIGQAVGRSLWEEMKRRGWKLEETAVCVPTLESLETARNRTEGAIEVLVQSGFPKERIFKVAQDKPDLQAALNSGNIVLTQHPEVKNWLIAGLNDEAVLGVVRATENRGIPAERVIGVGIGGDTGKVDFHKDKPTGFHAAVLIRPRLHGYDTAEAMYKWIAEGKEPPKETFTDGVLITRENFRKIMTEEGLSPD